MSTLTVERPGVKDDQGTGLCGGQVVLYNDNVNTFSYVVMCLMSVFRHSQALSEKIALEAHKKGRAVAEVEEPDKAKEHAEMLKAMGLKAEAEGF